MNDHIKQLMDQTLDKKFSHTWTALDHNDLMKFSEYFAELIIQECIAMCKTAVGNKDYNTGRMHCMDNIKEHFGVEE